MLDGIDGSGKSTVIEAWKEYLATEGNAIFDLTNYWQTRGDCPNYTELKNYDFIFSSEPTYVGVGKVIREELIRNNRRYPPRAIAEAYALDRLILYTKIIIPALKSGKCVIQDRGVSTSLVYQPLMEKTLTLKIVANLAGNKLALKQRPDHLVLLKIDPKAALGRLAKRTTKQDNVIFERLAFQKKISRAFGSLAFRQIFERRGTMVRYLPAEDKIGIMKSKAVRLLQDIIS